jgi:quercetin dioxygenase-like cupin family protein
VSEEDLDHTHDYDTVIHVISGEVLVRTQGIEKTLRSGDEMFIPRNQTHYSKVGGNGCRYVVAEKH